MPPAPEPRAFRCSVCNLNWPWSTAFYPKCPICHEPTAALKVEPMSDTEMQEVLHEHGLRYEPRTAPPAPAKQPRRRSPTRDEIRKLHDALDDWAREAPPWVRG